ncbi:hypothetical protein HX001_03045 [Empedobacter brevis]|uniref:Uncharacterized protein n=1 Tax=Empedobacter brevis TaxID=247 RepID=A0AAJ1V6S1_9FLAO|nr:hypothetical protein [Empedobacter brevis]MDM1071467.1 hypothetical protein [Empedobacter brevis]QHC85622.1 hypothetical protein AS589_12900 [Empedobacter brevis]
MIKILGFLVVTFLGFSTYKEINLEKVRANYSKMSTDKQLCINTIVELDNVKNKSAIYLGYLGGIQTINAKHLSNPLSKLKTFNKGKKNIEKAISIEPENLELRFIRLSVQKNAPSFLNYDSNVEEDTELLLKNSHRVRSIILRNNIDEILNR